jgi:hypothetical protein
MPFYGSPEGLSSPCTPENGDVGGQAVGIRRFRVPASLLGVR